MSMRSHARKRLRARRKASSAVGRVCNIAQRCNKVRRLWLLTLSTIAGALALAAPASADRVFTVDGSAAPGPARYDRVRVIEQGPRSAKNVLVMVPGTSGGAAYFRPVARDIVAGLPGWKTWSVDRRENLLEDHSVLGPVVARQRPASDAFRYYLESITDTSITPRFTPVADAPYVRRWGMGVAVRDLRNVIRAARRGGRRVVLAGHSLGATIAIAYATWDFRGRAGAEDLAGLVLIDGGSGGRRRAGPRPAISSTNLPARHRSSTSAASGCRGRSECSTRSARRSPCRSPTHRP